MNVLWVEPRANHPVNDPMEAAVPIRTVPISRRSRKVTPELLDVAMMLATAGELIPTALKALREGRRVVCAGIHMSGVPGFRYELLWDERELLSGADLTRQDAMTRLTSMRLATSVSSRW